MRKPSSNDLKDLFVRIQTVWDPHLAGQFNNQQIKLVKVSGPGDWQCHQEGDLFLMALRGEIMIHVKDRKIQLAPGQFSVILKGTRYRLSSVLWAELLLVTPEGLNQAGTLQPHRQKLKKL
jgi:mannose-6-phosphate isomerase-like protein (cupin superfamily)